MFNDRKGQVTDALLRIAGLALLASCWAAMHWLVQSVHAGPRHQASLLELAAAAIGFVTLTIGAGLAWLGAHVFDRVQVSERWASRRATAPQAAADQNDAVPAETGFQRTVFPDVWRREATLSAVMPAPHRAYATRQSDRSVSAR
jgi:hypothetical protein